VTIREKGTPQPPEDRNGRPLQGVALEVWRKRQAWIHAASEAEEDIRAVARVLAKVACRLTDKTDDQADALTLLAGREDAARMLRAAGLDRPDIMDRLRLDIADALPPAAGDQEQVPVWLRWRQEAQAFGRRGIPEGLEQDEDRGFLRRRQEAMAGVQSMHLGQRLPGMDPVEGEFARRRQDAPPADLDRVSSHG
jgi:hypothetical protein